MTIPVDKNASVEQVQAIWHAFKDAKEFKKYESAPGKIYWRSVVEVSSRSNDFEFLKQFGQVRKQIVDKIVSLAFLEAAKLKHCLSCETCVARSVGSTDPTSDYDITITGATSYLIVEEFYIIFRDIFEAESGDVFDTNVYGGPTEFTIWNNAVFNGIADDNLYKKVYLKVKQATSPPLRVFNIPEGFLTTLQPTDNEKPTKYCTSETNMNCVWNPTQLCTLERCWAFLAFFRFFHDDYKEFALKQFKTLAKKSQEDLSNYSSLSRVLQADATEYQKVALNKTCRAQPKPTMLKMCYMTNYYITLVGRANEAEKKFYNAIADNTSNFEQLAAMRNNLKNAIAHSNMYASEIYVTSGAVLHVVVATQMKLNLPGLLRTDDLFASFLENCGFAFHVFEETKPLDRFVDGPFCITALINGSKYLGRIFDALNRFKPSEKISTVIEQTATVRAKFRGHAESIDAETATNLFWSIVVNAEIVKQRTMTCLRNQFLRQYLQWVARKTEEFYS